MVGEHIPSRAFAVLELTRVVVGGDVLLVRSLPSRERIGQRVTYPPATHAIIDVVAELRRAGANASTDTEFTIRNEFSPLMQLLSCRAERVGVEKTSG